MRKLASIQEISSVVDIEEADFLQAAYVGGWPVVVKKNQFKQGDLAIFFEIDSWIPKDIAPFLVEGKKPKFYLGVEGYRLRTTKIRGHLSQGLLLPLEGFDIKDPHIGQDLTKKLGILLWDSAELQENEASTNSSNFPEFIPKTSLPRIQNIFHTSKFRQKTSLFTSYQVTEKLEGSSITFYQTFDEDGSPVFGVCSKNVDLQRTDTNAYWQAATKYGVEQKLRTLGLSVAIQAELIGPGIQKNIYNLPDQQIRVFSVYSITQSRYLPPRFAKTLCDNLELPYVPILNDNYHFPDARLEDILFAVNGISKLGKNVLREGLVFKSQDGSHSFKAISNEYLLKQK